MGLFENVIKAYIDTQTGGDSQRRQPSGSGGGPDSATRQRASNAAGQTFMQNLFANLTQGGSGRVSQAPQQQAQFGAAQPQQGPRTAAPSSKYSGSFGDSDDNDKAKAEESEAKLNIPGGKQRNKSWWHNNLDQALGTEGVGGFVNDVLSYSAPVAIADTFSPEWAYNPVSQEEAAKQTYGGNGPMEFNGDYGMPSADQLQQLTPEQQQEWWNDTFQGLNSSAAAAMAAGGQIANVGRAGARAIDPVLGLAKKNKGSSKAQRRAYSEAMKDSSSGARNESAREIVEDPTAYGLGEVGPAFGTQPIRSARGKLASEAANELPNSIRYGEMQGPKLRPVAPNSRVSQVAENILRQPPEASSVESFLARTAGQRKPTSPELAAKGQPIGEAASESVVENAVNNVTGGSLRNAIRNRNGGKRIKASNPGTEIDKIYASESKLDDAVRMKTKALDSIEEGTPEWDKAVKELEKAEGDLAKFQEENAAKKVNLANSDKSGYAFETVLDNATQRGMNRNMNEIHDTNRNVGRLKNLQSTGTGQHLGMKSPESVEALYDEATLNKMAELSDKGIDTLQNAINWNQAPNQSTMNRMIDEALKMERGASRYDARRVAGAAGGLTGLAGGLGTIQGFQTADAFGGNPAGFVPTSNVGFGENGDTIQQQETLEKVNEELPEGTAAVPNEEGGVDVVDTDTGELIHNISRQEWYQLSQGDQYRRATQDDEEFANYMRDTYGDAYVGDLGFEGFRDFNTGDKYNVVKDMLGYGDQRGYLPGWREMWEGSGVDFSGDEDQDIRNVMDYMWGEGNIISPDQWIAGGDEYQNAHTLGQKDEALHAAEYFLQQGGGDDLMKALGYPENTLDQEDMALLMMLQNEMNGNRSALKNYGDRDMEQISAILGLGGDTGKFGFDNEAGEEWESMFNPNKDLSWNNLYATAAQTGQLPAWAANLYGDDPNEPGVNSPVMADMADTYMAMIENARGKKVKRD